MWRSRGIVRERLGVLTWVTAAIVVVVAVADEARNTCVSGGPSGALLITAALVTGLALAVHS